MGLPKEQVLLVQYTDSDREALFNFFLSLFKGRKGQRAQAEKLMREVGGKSSVILAKRGKLVIGFAHYYPRENGDGIHFHQAAVLQAHRRQGIFKKLWSSVNEAVGRQAITAEIGVDAKHLPFLLHEGFIIGDSIPDFRVAIRRPSPK